MNYTQLQHLLAFLGYYGGTVDGLWGTASRVATERFQRDYGLMVDGIAGEKTQKALRGAIAGTMTKAKDTGSDFWDGIRHFKREEFACKCGQYHEPYCDGFPAEIREEVVRLAERAREHFGSPAHVVSGLRCKQHNADSGGVETSQHMYGEACDLRIEDVNGEELLAWLKAQPGVRYAYQINATNVHYDIPKGTR